MRKSLRPYLDEKVSAGDKFNFFAFLLLLVLIAVIGVWLWSMRDLIGRFGDSLGIFKNSGMVINQPEKDNFSIHSGGQPQGFVNTPEGVYNLNTVEGMVAATLASLPTPYPTYTPYPTFTPMVVTSTPTPEKTPYVLLNGLTDEVWIKSRRIENEYSQSDYITFMGKYSYFWPPYGGINCDNSSGVEECDYMASGEPVVDNVGIAWACDNSIPLYSRLYVEELNLWGICMDRGGAIKQDTDGLFWFDHLWPSGLITYGDKITVQIYYPK